MNKLKAVKVGTEKVILRLVSVLVGSGQPMLNGTDTYAIEILQKIGFIKLKAVGKKVSATLPDDEVILFEYERGPGNQKPYRLIHLQRGVYSEVDSGRTIYIADKPDMKGITDASLIGDLFRDWEVRCSFASSATLESFQRTSRMTAILPKDVKRYQPPPPPEDRVVSSEPMVVRSSPPLPVPPRPAERQAKVVVVRVEQPIPTVKPPPKPLLKLATLPVSPPTPIPAPAPPPVVATPKPAVNIDQVICIRKIPVNRIRRNPEQPRKVFNENELHQLMESLKLDGQNEPIEVIEVTGDPNADYELVKGERRWTAAQNISLTTLYAIVKSKESIPNRRAQHRACFTGDFHHAKYKTLEIANALMREASYGATQSELSAICGRSLSWVSKHLSLEKLDPELLALLDPLLPRAEQLSFSIATELARVPAEKQKELYPKIKRIRGALLQIAETKRLVSEALPKNLNGRAKAAPSKTCEVLERIITRLVANADVSSGYGDPVFASLVAKNGADNVHAMIQQIEATVQKLNALKTKMAKANESAKK